MRGATVDEELLKYMSEGILLEEKKVADCITRAAKSIKFNGKGMIWVGD